MKFLELRKAKNGFPIDTGEKRFKWQNLKDEHIIIYPEIYKKAHKKQFLLKETFIDNIRILWDKLVKNLFKYLIFLLIKSSVYDLKKGILGKGGINVFG